MEFLSNFRLVFSSGNRVRYRRQTFGEATHEDNAAKFILPYFHMRLICSMATSQDAGGGVRWVLPHWTWSGS